jgi:hypothetical protein
MMMIMMVFIIMGHKCEKETGRDLWELEGKKRGLGGEEVQSTLQASSGYSCL